MINGIYDRADTHIGCIGYQGVLRRKIRVGIYFFLGMELRCFHSSLVRFLDLWI